MKKIIIYFYIGLFVTSVSFAENRHVGSIYIGDKLVNEIHTLIFDKEVKLNNDTLEAFAKHISEKEPNIDNAFQWHGTQFAFAFSDMDNNGKKDLVVGHFESTTTGSVYIFNTIDKTPPVIYSFKYDTGYLVRSTALNIQDFNNDGILDIFFQQNTGAQRDLSFDCILIRNKLGSGLLFNKCFYQNAGLFYEDIHEYLNSHKNRLQSTSQVYSVSSMVDFNKDGIFEYVVTKERCERQLDECSRAEIFAWPEMYYWIDNTYKQVNSKNLNMYKYYKNMLNKIRYSKNIRKLFLKKQL